MTAARVVPSTAEPKAAGELAAPGTTEGLRERQKKQTRQLISDTATGMFLADGFDAVRVIDVATACGVSEKTVYNHFPTKESLIFDRFDDMEIDIRRVFGPDGTSPVEAAVEVIVAQVEGMLGDWGGPDRPGDLTLIGRFSEMIQQTPALRAAQWEMLDRMAQIAAEGIAVRAGLDPDDPEPLIAANAILGLWRVQFRSMARNATAGRPSLEVRDAVIADVRRAAELVDAGLASLRSGPSNDRLTHRVQPSRRLHRGITTKAPKGPATSTP
jgi:AcrR family transcriptional regulator